MIGVRYKTRGKHPKTCTVVDILKTYNSKGELVHTRYVSEHEFLGQKVTNYDVVLTTIKMGMEKWPGEFDGISAMAGDNYETSEEA